MLCGLSDILSCSLCNLWNESPGVGLNVGNRRPTTCLDALLEGINEEAPCLLKDELLAAIMNKFEYLFEVFCSQGEQHSSLKYRMKM